MGLWWQHPSFWWFTHLSSTQNYCPTEGLKEHGAGEGLTWSWEPSGLRGGRWQWRSSGREAAGICRSCQRHRRRQRSKGTGGQSPWQHTSSPHSPGERKGRRPGISHIIQEGPGSGISNFHHTSLDPRATVPKFSFSLACLKASSDPSAFSSHPNSQV